MAARTSNTTNSPSRSESTTSPCQCEIIQAERRILCIVDAAASSNCSDKRMTRTTDALASIWSRPYEEVVRHRVEGWAISTHTTDAGNAGCAEVSDASVLSSISNARACNVLAGHATVPSTGTTSRPNVAWHYGDTAEEELSERTLSLEVKVHRELIQDVNVSNVRERCSLESACSVEVDVAVLYVPCCDRTRVLPVVTTVQRETKISRCVCKVCRVTIAQCCRGARGTAWVAEEAVTSSHPVNVLQNRGTLRDTGSSSKSCRVGTLRVLRKERVIDVA